MTPYELVGWTLNNTTAVTAITSTRIWHGLRPRNDTMPSINYFELGAGQREWGIERQGYSINCRAETPAAARDLAREVVTVFAGADGTGTHGTNNGFDVGRASLRAGQGLIPEPGDKIFNAPVDIDIIYAVSTVS